MVRSEFATRLFAWLDGELDDDTAREMERYVEGDPDARRFVDAGRALQARVREAPIDRPRRVLVPRGGRAQV